MSHTFSPPSLPPLPLPLSAQDNGDGHVTLDELVAFHGTFPELMRPAFALRSKVQARVVNDAFWEKQSKSRQRHYPNKDDIMEILLSKRNEARDEAEHEAGEIERRKEAEASLLASETGEETANRKRAEALQKQKERDMEAQEESELRESKVEFELCSQSLAAASQRADNDARDRAAVLFIPSINRYITASLAELEHRKDKDRQTANKKTKQAVDNFFQDPEGLKLLKMRTQDELRKSANKSFFRSTAQKKEAREKAYQAYLGQKLDKSRLEIESKFKDEDVELTTRNRNLKEAATKQLGQEEKALSSWQWKEQFSSIRRVFCYVCEATGTTLWEQPFDNLASICTVCKNADAADLRCQQCHVEICHECDMVEHWGAVKSQHRRVAVSDDEKDWRVRKKDFDRRLAENRASALMLELE